MLPLNSQNDPGDQKNMLMAILLSVGVLLAWQYFYASPKVAEERKRRAQIESQKEQVANRGEPNTAGQVGGSAPSAPGTQAGPIPSPNSQGGTAPAATSVSRKAALQRTKRVNLSSESLLGSVNLTGGRIDDISLLKYRETIKPDSPNIILFSPANAPKPYFAEHGWVPAPGTNTKVPGSETVWSLEGSGELTPAKPLTLVWNNGAGLTFKRVISLDDNYMFKIDDTVKNATGKAVSLFPYARIFRAGTPKIEGFWVQHEGMIGFIGEQKLQELDYSEAIKPGGNLVFTNQTGGWVGFTDKYWASALIPDQAKPYRANMKLARPKSKRLPEAFQSDYLLPAVTIAPQSTATVSQRLFVGAKKVDLINKYEADDRVLEFNYLVDWGWFYFLTKPLYQLLHWLNGIFGNFGVAILAVTVLVKAAFFWFANKSYESMAKMKKLQPKMVEIRDRYKDDKMRQQQELMALYKDEKINPLAGCLPVLIQIPVFFALYKVLFVSIDMRHAPFFGWIQDLSAPDPTSIFNLFGLLPYDLPNWTFLIVGVWPLIMGITMWLQMQLNPQQPDPVQQAVFNWMPVLFTFLLASFPAGLVIYWAWNNILSLAQQWFIMKRQGADIPIMENLQRNFSAIGKFVDGLRNRQKS